ncbi:FAD-dependent oxidoreductase [Jiangella sp. DSM 45060]|uniref:FAD-dependent oxidoreductase n=1 Tax=Jiangella sp. DSM 45060 TaxID=1798224 RepID=UPI00087B58EB|nr:FAD-dependent oxidoreductase [Jiangella sp. DSM 45060]SDT33267.1 FAD dependent oxidoreductase [Jiangella sp. DSM 45060]
MHSDEWEVVVVGGGAAGIAAALAAGRTGARTLLIERAGFVGGVSATLPWLGFHDQSYRRVVRGLAGEFVETLARSGHASPITLDPKCGSLAAVHSHYWKILALRLLREAGVAVLMHAVFVDTVRSGDRITGVVIESKSGRETITGHMVIDCSGDGDVAARGGVAWEKGRTSDGLVQSPTLVFRLGGIDDDAFRKACQDPAFNYREWLAPYPHLFAQMAEKLETVDTYVLGGFAGVVEQARRAGDLNVPQTRIVGVKLHTRETPHELSVVMTRVLGLDPTDVDSLSEAYARVYEQVPELIRFFRTYVPGCERAHLVEIAPMLGIRESRRIMGDYLLTADDLVTGARHDDDVAMGGYHIDIHRPSGSWVSSTNVRAYGIPLRSLIARDVDGLLMAGKCISATHEAIASTRVIPICIAEGQAAGTAAALAALSRRDVRSVPVPELQTALVAAGAELGLDELERHPDADSWPQLPFEETQVAPDPVIADSGWLT